MKVTERRYGKTIDFFLVLIAITLIFRKPCTYIIILFAIFGLLFFRKIEFTKKVIQLSLIIALPLIVEILFFWNNDSFILGLKSLEKSISLLIFPILIIGNYKYVNFINIIRYYSFITTFVVLVFYLAYVNFDKEYVTVFSQDPQYFWTIGYSFSNFIGMHGPALNMHLAFVTISNFYFIFDKIKPNNKLFTMALKAIVFIISFYFVIFINSKLALANVVLGMLIVFFIELRKIYSIKKLIVLFVFFFSIISLVTLFYVKQNPYMIVKYKEVTFAHLDKIGKLDEIENPTATIYNSLVTRLSIWKSTIDLISKNFLYGVGSSDGKLELFKYYKETNQKFLAENQFPVHNQYLDSLLRFGLLGLFSTIIYMFNIFRLWLISKNTLVLFFFFLFFSSNLTDDFLIRFDGIIFSSFWISIFSACVINKCNSNNLAKAHI